MNTTKRRRPLGTTILKAGSALKLSERTIKSLSGVFKLLADESRLKILFALAQDGELHVSALCDLLNQSQPAVSHHLTLLRMANLVHFRRDGKHNLYSVDSTRIRELLDAVCLDTGSTQKQLNFSDFTLAYKRK